MKTITEQIDVAAPRSFVYERWTQFESFPDFMSYVTSVTPNADGTYHWTAKIAGISREWDAAITEQVDGQTIAWKSTDGTENGGRVNFADLPAGGTAVMLALDFEGHGFLEHVVGESLGIVESMAQNAIGDFKRLIEQEFADTGGVAAPTEAPAAGA